MRNNTHVLHALHRWMLPMGCSTTLGLAMASEAEGRFSMAVSTYQSRAHISQRQRKTVA